MSLQKQILLLCFVNLVGCTTAPVQHAIIIENNEKDIYIHKIEQTVSETASALVAVVPQIPAGINRELVNNQTERLSAISKPSVQTVEMYKKILQTNNEQALQTEDKKADKSDTELQRIKELVIQRDSEITAVKIEKAEVEAREQREIKNKILWMLSCLGAVIVTAGLLVVVFTPWKARGAMLIAGGSLATSVSWIFDTKWFPLIVGTALAIIVADMVVMAVAWLHDKWIHKSVS